MLWALLGLYERASVPELKTLLDSGDNLNDNLGATAKSGAQMGRALALTAMINLAANKFAQRRLADASEALSSHYLR